MLSFTMLATLLLTISWIFMLYCMIPQIILNWRLHYARGMSDFMLIGNLIMNICGIFFIFGCQLPLVYQLMGSAGFFLFLIVLWQRTIYHWPESSGFFFIVLAIFSIFALSLPIVFLNPYYYGTLLGWVGFWAQFLYLFPQIFKILKTKSVEGFSFTFITLLTLANLFELMGALILDLPLNIIANDIRGLLMYIVFCILFWKYGK